MDSTQLIKHLWIKYDGDPKAILKAIKEKTDLPASDTEAKEIELKIAKFDSDYDSLTVVDSEFQAKLQPRLAEKTAIIPQPFLIRWNRAVTLSVKKCIIDEFDQNVFILDGNLKKYNIPETINGFGYIYDNDTESYQIYHTCISDPILVTKSIEEVKNFAILSCKFLLIGSKCDELNESFKTQILHAYYNDDDIISNIMAIPGKPGCFANKCLKSVPEIMFIDCWDDIYNVIHTKEEKKHE